MLGQTEKKKTSGDPTRAAHHRDRSSRIKSVPTINIKILRNAIDVPLPNTHTRRAMCLHAMYVNKL